MTNDSQFLEMTTHCSSYMGLLPVFSILIAIIITIRSILLWRAKGSEIARNASRRCFLGLHLQAAFGMIYATWQSISGLFLLRELFEQESSPALFSMQCVNLSILLWIIMLQFIVSSACALIVAGCSGFRPQLWQPRYTIVSIILCIVGQGVAYGIFTVMRQH